MLVCTRTMVWGACMRASWHFETVMHTACTLHLIWQRYEE